METSRIAHEVLAYLSDNPNSEDTLEGIVEWWMLEREIKRHTGAVRRALADLVVEGLVVERRGPDSQVRYQVNRARLRDVRKLIRESPE